MSWLPPVGTDSEPKQKNALREGVDRSVHAVKFSEVFILLFDLQKLSVWFEQEFSDIANHVVYLLNQEQGCSVHEHVCDTCVRYNNVVGYSFHEQGLKDLEQGEKEGDVHHASIWLLQSCI